MPKRILKFGNNHEVPDGAIYLSSHFLKAQPNEQYPMGDDLSSGVRLWHFFLVDAGADGLPAVATRELNATTDKTVLNALPK